MYLKNKKLNVRIVCYEDVDRWILGKFAIKMQENLTQMGIYADIAKVPNPNADINHHIIYGSYGAQISKIDTLMVTHIDSITKLALLKEQLKKAKLGICMSAETMNNLIHSGIPREKLCYVNPAHDGVIKPRKLRIGITCRVQNDGRKREYFLLKLAKKLNPNDFEFIIMGEYWDPYVSELKKNKFLVTYHEKFNYDEYIKLIPSLDYYLYMGLDEGQMGYMDALAAGVKTIVTAQGYHLDAKDGMSYPFTTYNELLSIFENIVKERNILIESVSTWNWREYTCKHVEVWNALIAKTNSQNQKEEYNNLNKNLGIKLNKYYISLITNWMTQLYFRLKNRKRGY